MLQNANAKNPGKVLFMDDQKSVRDMMEKMLFCLGYKVEMAEEGTKAINLYKQALRSGRPFDIYNTISPV